MNEPENFHGHQPRECGEHRTVGAHRAWCYDCCEWCYPESPCVRCEIIGLSDAPLGRVGVMNPEQRECMWCGRGQTHNPAHILEDPDTGYEWECIPCLVRQRNLAQDIHRKYERAHAALRFASGEFRMRRNSPPRPKTAPASPPSAQDQP